MTEAAIEFPELVTADLDVAEVQQLFDDVATCTRLLDVLVKSGALQHADPNPVALESARQRLLSGEVRALQLRYVHDGSEWRDTLVAVDGVFRLTRIRL